MQGFNDVRLNLTSDQRKTRSKNDESSVPFSGDLAIGSFAPREQNKEMRLTRFTVGEVWLRRKAKFFLGQNTILKRTKAYVDIQDSKAHDLFFIKFCAFIVSYKPQQ